MVIKQPLSFQQLKRSRSGNVKLLRGGEFFFWTSVLNNCTFYFRVQVYRMNIFKYSWKNGDLPITISYITTTGDFIPSLDLHLIRGKRMNLKYQISSM